MDRNDRKMLLAVCEVIKKKFPNLTTMELINFAMEILDAAEKASEEIRNGN